MPSPDRPEEPTRRGLFKWAIGALGAAIAVTAGWPLISSLVGPMYRRTVRKYTDVGPMDAIPEGQPTRLTYVEGRQSAYIYTMEEREVWAIRHSATSVTVFSPICPHLGCRYTWFPEAREFVCPCHGSVFSVTGRVLAGPSPRPLDTLPHKIENGNLYIMWERFKPGIPEKVPV